MATVRLSNISKTYPNGAKAVHPTSFDIADGELIVLVGPSGCGKSTLLRMVAGLEDITTGELSIGERIVNTLDPAERDIAMVFQNYALYPHMTVGKNMAYGLKNRGIDKATIAAKVDTAAQMLNLTEYLDRRPSQLSGGQRQRVAMGRAIVRDPALFLFDEPLSNLDAKLRNQMRIEIRALQRRLNTTAMYVTHDQVEAMTMADRIVVLNGGQVEQIGTPSEIYRAPASTFVASFMGAPPMNLIPAHYNGNGTVAVGSLSLPIARPADHKGEVVLGIRPEDATIGGTTPFKLDLIEELGANRLLHGTIDGNAFTVNAPNDDQPLATDLTLSLPNDTLHLFHGESGVRL
ncbi:sn-glycerol 3-phosphate transport system ATP-binding protein [Monaibacterium marinum]|uniref:sn-glycerol 3-phosphate transport system ATP-binding protein n=1 Tax=Pontivivens marinum TaxID=1690039 RepID=A0A2C9CWW6_9RHOB|nr:sn-glycerol-3-phosphate ABC transporter ATP-binding protein UgpC [Monaibacterium marinum]SOH95693.1 sn-glycerol 3-phosphate transport system ATP-binding protein [Monaibacterium marinum]